MSDRPPYFVIKEPHGNHLREIPHIVQLWFQNCKIRKVILYRQFVGKEEEVMGDNQITSYPYSEYKYWKKFGDPPPTGLQSHLNHFSIIEFTDSFSPTEAVAMVDYRITYEYQIELDGEWFQEEWKDKYYIDTTSISGNWLI